MFGVARSKELGADDLAQIAASAIAGSVGTLLIEADRHIPAALTLKRAGLSSTTWRIRRWMTFWTMWGSWSSRIAVKL